MNEQQAEAGQLERAVGRYQLREQLGAGGMGAVYRAWDPVHGREVALKLAQLTAAPPAKRKLLEALFEREYHTLVRLKHPHVVPVYEYGIDAHGPYYRAAWTSSPRVVSPL